MEQVEAGPPPGAVAGASNEAGGVYRAGVVAYLAAHGLAGEPIELLSGASGLVPVVIRVEADAAVDDVECAVSNGTCLYLQAKRTADMGRTLQESVAQWVRAVRANQLQPGDRIGLITGAASEPLRILGQALDRRRRQASGALSAREQTELSRLTQMLPDDLTDEQREQLLTAAHIVGLEVEDSTDSAFREAGRLLENAIVPVGQGLPAMRALQAAIPHLAKRRYGCALDDWLALLRQANITVLADIDGVAGSRRQAGLEAVDAHRARIAAVRDLLRLSAFVEDLPPMPVNNLVDDFVVQLDASEPAESGRESKELVMLARCWLRLCVLGLPGAGKSTALEQVAAAGAADSLAPVPVLVRLRNLALWKDQHDERLTLYDVVHAGTTQTAPALREALGRELVDRLNQGRATLLLDGLDECGAHRGDIADDLAEMVALLPADTPVIVSTRDLGQAAATKLGLPFVRLQTPRNLNRRLRELVQHAPRHRVDGADRPHWIARRQEWLRDAARVDEVVWKVPLLATLLTLLACTDRFETLPDTRAALLTAAVDDSVRRWESRRNSYPEQPAWQPELDAALLLDGLAARRADAVATDVMRFWDDAMGVFVADHASGLVQARSRTFIDIADAWWAARQDTDVQTSWLTAALDAPDRYEAGP